MTTPTPQIDLDELLRELASNRGITGRARILARHWRQLRGLSDEQRQRVALALGSEAAGRQLERLFLRDGVLSEDERAVTEALERLGEADPAELRDLVESLREGGSREAGRRLLGALQAALEEKPAEPAVESALEAEPWSPGATPPEPATAPPEPATAPSEPAPEQGAARLEPATSPSLEAAPPRRPVSRPPEAESAKPGARPAESIPGPEGESRPPGPDDAVFDRQREPRAAPPAEPDRGIRRGPQPALPAVERLRRLRRLHRDPDHLEALGPEGRAALRARMGDGWAARRCVSAMIRSGRLDGLDEAMALIESLHSPAAVTWCLADLIAAGGLGEPELRRVLAAAPSAAARRRLERRAARRREPGRRTLRA